MKKMYEEPQMAVTAFATAGTLADAGDYILDLRSII